jgi:translation initiation factor 1A|tara:strand:- start:803 stop:1267 length:465 start_codon:yes stop_codon:yes gene_type:complete
MVNKKGGKKHKKGKKSGQFETKQLRYKEEGQEYAQITRMKGNCRFDVKCFDGKERMAIMCGGMRKRKFVNLQQVVLVSLRDFQDSVCDIIDSYDDNQVRELKEKKEIPDFIKLEEENMFSEDLGDDDIFDTSLPPDDISDEEEEEEDGIDLDDI